jgi:ankyrin repeat protein
MLLADNQFATVQSLPMLIAHGARLDLRDKDGKTALQLARESQHAPAVKILEAAGARE